jgi:ubiquinone/menaquinone biosynthesis C-methylase UbiE
MNTIKKLVKEVCPPILITAVRMLQRRLGMAAKGHRKGKGSEQSLDIYWDEDFANALETWGEGNAWNEIQLLMAGRKGKVLDIACGTGKTLELLSGLKCLDLYGCDISDMLISKAMERGIDASRLLVCDATQMPYADNEYDFAFSIGSIEHFTEDGINKFLGECYRVVRGVSFHQHPVSRSGENEGWVVTSNQSYFNNSVAWWKQQYEAIYETVVVLDSVWSDEISLGRWFVCVKQY